MNENIHQELIKLQDELSRLKNAVEHIDEAKEASKNVINSAENFLLTSKKIGEDYEILAKKTELLVKEIDSIDFPERLNKIESNIAGINAGVQNVFSRIESVERNLMDKISFIIGGLEKLEEKLAKIKICQDNMFVYYRKVNKWIFISFSTIIALITVFMLFLLFE